MRFKTILIDPPWPFKVWSKATGSGRSAESHYKTMSMKEIAALDLCSIADDPCALFCWACWPSMRETFQILDAWKFTYRTLAFDWVKLTRRKQLHFGLGYWTRANSEPCLLATRGKVKRLDKSVGQIILEDDYGEEGKTLLAEYRGHSVKPLEQYKRIEKLVSGPYVEIFARSVTAGWASAGEEIDGLDINDSIRRLSEL